jgi:ParB-like chromosome segregation protein Spo0J
MLSGTRKLHELKPHPKNGLIFGDPRAVPEYEEIKQSIRIGGLQEPLIVKEDGTILSGHLRFTALREIAADDGKYTHEVDVSVRVHADFESDSQELEYLFNANTQRRQLSPRQIAHAYHALVQSLRESSPKRGRPLGSHRRAIPIGKRRPDVKERAARLFHISVRNADNLALVYQTPGMPADVLNLVDSHIVSVRIAAEAVRHALSEAKRRNPEGPFVVDPADVYAFISYPTVTPATKVKDIVLGAKPGQDPKIEVDGTEVSRYFGRVETSNIPPPYQPDQLVSDMISQGVKYSDRALDDPRVPVQEAVNHIRAKLIGVFARGHNLNEERVAAALDPLLDLVAHYLRAMGKEVSVGRGKEVVKKALPDTMYERLVLLRTVLEEEDPTCDVAILRVLLTDIARRAQEKASAIRKEKLAIRPRPSAETATPVPRREAPVFSSEIEYITHTLGADLLDILSA